MASEYYGLKGNLVKRYQQILNSLGASIKVNGKWDKATESAFNTYRDGFLEAIGLKTPENPYTMMDFAPRSEEALRQSAENRTGALFGAQIEALDTQSRDKESDLKGQIASLDTTFEKNLAQLAEQYKQARQTLSDAALKRGLGRSSYVTDRLSDLANRSISDGQSLAAANSNQKQAIEEAITTLKNDTRASRNRLLNEREQSILGAIDEYRQADQEKAAQALQYNNTMTEKFNQQRIQQEQFQQELENALRIARMRR